MTGDDDEQESLLPEMEDQTPNAADPKSTARARRKHQFREDQRVEFVRNKVLSDPVGRRWLWAMLTDLGTWEDKFACTPSGFKDPDATWFFAGQKSFGQRLYKSIMLIDPGALIAMHQENDPQFQKPKPVRVTRNQDE